MNEKRPVTAAYSTKAASLCTQHEIDNLLVVAIVGLAGWEPSCRPLNVARRVRAVRCNAMRSSQHARRTRRMHLARRGSPGLVNRSKVLASARPSNGERPLGSDHAATLRPVARHGKCSRFLSHDTKLPFCNCQWASGPCAMYSSYHTVPRTVLLAPSFSSLLSPHLACLPDLGSG